MCVCVYVCVFMLDWLCVWLDDQLGVDSEYFRELESSALIAEMEQCLIEKDVFEIAGQIYYFFLFLVFKLHCFIFVWLNKRCKKCKKKTNKQK